MDEQIRSNRRKIYWAITIYIWVIVLVTAVCGAWIVLTYDNLAGWLAFAGFFLLDFVMIRVATGSGMWIVRWVLRATTVYPGGAEEARDAVDDISIATGMPAPEIMLIDEDFRNAISLKGRRGTAIIVTRGLLDDLDDDELRAVMAHEMAHLYNEDARLNTFIASLRGFSLIVRSLFGHVFGILRFARPRGGLRDADPAGPGGPARRWSSSTSGLLGAGAHRPLGHHHRRAQPVTFLVVFSRDRAAPGRPLPRDARGRTGRELDHVPGRPGPGPAQGRAALQRVQAGLPERDVLRAHQHLRRPEQVADGPAAHHRREDRQPGEGPARASRPRARAPAQTCFSARIPRGP